MSEEEYEEVDEAEVVEEKVDQRYGIDVRELTKNQKKILKFGDEALQKKNYPYAVKMYRRILKSQPLCHTIREKLHESHLKNVGGKPSMFRAIWAGIVAEVVKLKMKTLWKQDKYNEAMDLGEYCMSVDPTAVASCRALAESAEEAGYPMIARMAFEMALPYNSKNVTFLDHMAYVYGKNDEGKKCLATYQKIASLQPDKPKWQDKVRESAARAAMDDGWTDLEKGDKNFQDNLKDKEGAELLEQEGRSHATADGRQKLIDAHLEKLAITDTVQNRRQMADLYQEAEQWADAAIWYEKTNELSDIEDPATQRLIFEMNIKGKEVELNQFILQANESGDAELLAQAEVRKFDLIELKMESFEYSIKKNPGSHEDRYGLAQLLVEIGREDDALPHFQRVSENPRYHIEALMNIGICFLKKEQYDMSLGEFEKIIADKKHMDKEKKGALYYKGKCLLALSRDDEAMTCFREIYQSDVGFMDVQQIIEG
ncbi:MAG: hypothetical protein HRT89_25525 [Lentisphaeria bacterium]|nr:hypothetical protein [Lentisphaeria bacterium]NQZ71421.1 hypothetical protein [Lentisphaeria bacterium]